MTIVAGFKCWDGIVLCADTEETKGDYSKVSRPKVLIYPAAHVFPITCRAVFASSGNASHCDHLIQKLCMVIDGVQNSDNIDTVIKKIEDEIVEVNTKWPLYDSKDEPTISILLAVYKDKHQALLHIEGHRVLIVTWPYHGIGYGVVLADYLAEKLYPQTTSTVDASIVGLYILDQVKTHVPFCGKESQVVVLSKDGNAKYQDIVDLSGQEALFIDFDKWMQSLLAQVVNLDVSNDVVTRSFKNSSASLLKLRDSYRHWKEMSLEIRERQQEEFVEASSRELEKIRKSTGR